MTDKKKSVPDIHPNRNIDREQIAAFGKAASGAKETSEAPKKPAKKVSEEYMRGLREMAARINMM